jgi:hypothetical protein
MSNSQAFGTVDARFRAWRERHIALMERLSDVFEKLSTWIRIVRERSVEPKAEVAGSSPTPSEQIDALTGRIKLLETIAEAVPKVQALAFTTLSSMREMSDKLIDAREDGTLTGALLDEGDEELATAERTIAAIEDGLDSLTDS